VHNLANASRYRDAVRDIQDVFQPAEERLLEMQQTLEQAARDALEQQGATVVEGLVNDYTRQSMTQVGHAYIELVDYLMFKYLVPADELAPQRLPEIAPPVLPDGRDLRPIRENPPPRPPATEEFTP
jgi:hypothetical protein